MQITHRHGKCKHILHQKDFSPLLLKCDTSFRAWIGFKIPSRSLSVKNDKSEKDSTPRAVIFFIILLRSFCSRSGNASIISSFALSILQCDPVFGNNYQMPSHIICWQWIIIYQVINVLAQKSVFREHRITVQLWQELHVVQFENNK